MEEKKNRKFCPLIKSECLEDKCMWFVRYRGVDECAVALIAVNSEYDLAMRYSRHTSDW